MRSLFKLSIAAVAMGALMWVAGSANAMMVMGPDQPVQLEIGGFGGVITSLLTPHESPAGEVPPSQVVTTTELRLNVNAGTDTMKLNMSRWIREGNGEINFTFNESPYQFGEIIWRPMPELRIQAGSLVYVPWADRAIQWEHFSAVGPIFPSGTYTGYIENSPGIDFGYKIGDLEVGIGLFTYAAITGGATNLLAAASNGTPGTSRSAQTFVPHFLWASGPLALRLSFYSEMVTTSTDDWASDDGGLSNTLLVLDFRFQYDEAGSFVKADFLTADGDSYGTGNTTISATISQMLGSNTVWVSFNSDTASGGVDGVDQSYVQIGYKIPLGPPGADIRFQFATQDNSVSSASTIDFVLFQSF
jgi:hypothetical protein